MKVKICGLRTRADVSAAADAGAAFVGLVFFAASPRAVTIGDARWIVEAVPAGVARVALTVNADDAFLDAIYGAVSVDMLQLHGEETPERVAEVRARYRLPVMKAVGIAGENDLGAIADHARVADMILVDARAPKGAAHPGGNGRVFDWRLIAGRRWRVPWMLAGGLTPATVGEAIRQSGAPAVDVSSGVESAPGIKDHARLRAFVAAARHAAPDKAVAQATRKARVGAAIALDASEPSV